MCPLESDVAGLMCSGCSVLINIPFCTFRSSRNLENICTNVIFQCYSLLGVDFCIFTKSLKVNLS